GDRYLSGGAAEWVIMDEPRRLFAIPRSNQSDGCPSREVGVGLQHLRYKPRLRSAVLIESGHPVISVADGPSNAEVERSAHSHVDRIPDHVSPGQRRYSVQERSGSGARPVIDQQNAGYLTEQGLYVLVERFAGIEGDDNRANRLQRVSNRPRHHSGYSLARCLAADLLFAISTSIRLRSS